MERAGSTGNGGGMDYPPTEVVTSEEDELMQNASGNRSPIHPDTFIDALQNADSHDSNRLASMTASLRPKARASPNSGVSRHQSANRPIPSVAGSAGQMALPNASAARPTSIVPWVANANVGIAGPMAVPTQHHMSAPTAQYPCKYVVQELATPEETHCMFNKSSNRFNITLIQG